MKIVNKNKMAVTAFGIMAVACLIACGIAMKNTVAIAEEPAGFTISEKGSVKLMTNEIDSGLRFNFSMTTEYYNSLLDEETKAFRSGVEVGAMLIPTDLAEGSAITYEAAKTEGSLISLTEIPAELWKPSAEDGWMTTYAYLYDIPASGYNRDISAKGFVKDNDATVEYTGVAVRNIAQVALAAIKANPTLPSDEQLGEAQLALLDKYLLEYQVTIEDEQGSVLQKFFVKYGDTIQESDVTVMPGENEKLILEKGDAVYDFSTPVTGDLTLTAVFESLSPAAPENYNEKIGTTDDYMLLDGTDGYKKFLNTVAAGYTFADGAMTTTHTAAWNNSYVAYTLPEALNVAEVGTITIRWKAAESDPASQPIIYLIDESGNEIYICLFKQSYAAETSFCVSQVTDGEWISSTISLKSAAWATTWKNGTKITGIRFGTSNKAHSMVYDQVTYRKLGDLVNVATGNANEYLLADYADASYGMAQLSRDNGSEHMQLNVFKENGREVTFKKEQSAGMVQTDFFEEVDIETTATLTIRCKKAEDVKVQFLLMNGDTALYWIDENGGSAYGAVTVTEDADGWTVLTVDFSKISDWKGKTTITALKLSSYNADAPIIFKDVTYTKKA